MVQESGPTDTQQNALASVSVADLFTQVFAEEREFGDSDDAWPDGTRYAYQELQWRGTDDVFRAALGHLASHDRTERAVAVNVLGQLGWHTGGTFVEESVAALAELARSEQEWQVHQSIGYALGHRGSPSGRTTLLTLARHASEQVRFAAATALDEVATDGDGYAEAVIDALMTLTADNDEDVRNWATFGLGTQLDIDTPAVRDALVARLDDSHDETRAEAIVALARRHDARALTPTMKALTTDLVGALAVESAAILGDASLLPALLELRAWWDVDVKLLETAIRRCDPIAGADERTFHDRLVAAVQVGFAPRMGDAVLISARAVEGFLRYDTDLLVDWVDAQGTSQSRGWDIDALRERVGKDADPTRMAEVVLADIAAVGE